MMRGGFHVVISPDGRHVVFPGTNEEGRSALYLRALSTATITPIPGTDGGAGPFWAPDSQQIAFASHGKLKRVKLAGGEPQPICDVVGTLMGGAWAPDGTLLFATYPGPLQRVSASGGEPTPLYERSSGARSPAHTRPSFLPDGRRFVFTDAGAQTRDKTLFLGSLDGAPLVPLATVNSVAEYVAGGYLAYVRKGTLLLHPFDAQAGRLRGEPVSLADDVTQSFRSAAAAFSVSGTGTLVYRPRGQMRDQFVWFDRAGKRVGEVGEPARHDNFDLSPDGQRIVYASTNARTGATSLWQLELQRGVTSLVASGHALEVNDPVWLPDGQHILYTARGERPAIMRQSVHGGAAETVFAIEDGVPVSEDVSRDGRFVAIGISMAQRRQGQRGALLPLTTGAPGEPLPLAGGVDVDELHFAPDGRLIAYNAIELDRWDIYLAPVPPNGQRWQVSTAGGVQARWRADGRELFYLALDGTLMAVEIGGSATQPRIGKPRPLFKTGLRPSGYVDQYLVHPSGDRFLVNLPFDDPETQPLNVVLDAIPAGDPQGEPARATTSP
jgi:Tol biopolymer transport system component